MFAYRDDNTPEGTFAATTKVLGVVVAYLFAGRVEDPAAKCPGRVEYISGPGVSPPRPIGGAASRAAPGWALTFLWRSASGP